LLVFWSQFTFLLATESFIVSQCKIYISAQLNDVKHIPVLKRKKIIFSMTWMSPSLIATVN
jgi:hypothetical protein